VPLPSHRSLRPRPTHHCDLLESGLLQRHRRSSSPRWDAAMSGRQAAGPTCTPPRTWWQPADRLFCQHSRRSCVSLVRPVPREREDHRHTSSGACPAPSPLCWLCSAAASRDWHRRHQRRACLRLHRQRVLGPDRARTPESRSCPASEFSSTACPFPLLLAGAARSPCSNGCGGADHIPPVRDSRSPGNLSRPDHRLTPHLPAAGQALLRRSLLLRTAGAAFFA